MNNLFSTTALVRARDKYRKLLGEPTLELVLRNESELDRLRGDFYMIRDPDTKLPVFYVEEIPIRMDERVPACQIQLHVDGLASQEWET